MSRQTGGLVLWMLQRVSAIYLAIFILCFVAWLYLSPPADYQAWRAWLAQPLVSVTFAGFILALLVHGWVGMRNVVLDYVHPLAVRLVMLTLIGFLLVGCGYWALRILIVAGL